jgi:competence protein ComEA
MHIALIAALLCAAAGPPALALATAPAAGTPSASAEEQAPPRTEKHRKKRGKPPMTGVLNVNRATEAELRLLPGIGKKRAEQIVERRGKKPFASLDELGRMKGMRNLVHKLRANLSVEGDTTLRPLRP